MELQEMDKASAARRGRMRKTAAAAGALLLFALAAGVAFALCSFRLQYVTQDILSKQRDIQRAWVDKSLESVRTWRNKLVEQARFISGAEMFRLFAADARALGSDAANAIAGPQALDSPDESVRSMAEQLVYMQDILQDFVNRRGWIAARATTPDGAPLVVPADSAPLGAEQIALIRRADADRGPVFGSLRVQNGTLVVDMAEPLYEVLGGDDSSPVAVLLITVPVEKKLASFLAVNKEQRETLQPSITAGGQRVSPDDADKTDKVTLKPLARLADAAGAEAAPLPDLPFARRPALDGNGEAYSLSGRLSLPDWRVVVETPASLVDEQVKTQKVQIYGLGVLGSLGVALVLAVISISLVSRAHQRTALRFQQLYTVIRHQKLLLDSINASLQVGLLLVDGHGRVQLCNPEFCRIADHADPEGVALADVLPGEASLALRRGMEAVAAGGKADSIEISLAAPDAAPEEARLYRVTLFPFEEPRKDGSRSVGGCVGIFQDITQFRRRAEAARKRQIGVVQGLVRAIESVDANLVGHSDKMARVAELLGAHMVLPDKDRETLRLAARLSQVGKIFVPRHLLTRQGKLTPEERQEVARAPEYANGVLRNLQFDLPVPETVSQMGERFDGRGAPRGLKGEEILLCARILSVINAFIAMVSARSYRAGMSIDEAVAQLSRDPGFDPDVVRALADIPADAVRRAVDNEETNQRDDVRPAKD